MSNDGLKKFLDWVNADTGLPPEEERPDYEPPEAADGHDDHHDDHEDDHGDHGDDHEDYVAAESASDDDAPDEELENLELLMMSNRRPSAGHEDHEASASPGPCREQELIGLHYGPDAHDVHGGHSGHDVHAVHGDEHHAHGTKGGKAPSAFYSYYVFSMLLALFIITVLLAAVGDLPPFGDPNNPAANEVYTRYIERGMQETGAINIVAAMILDYRAFDTLGEALVLFTAVISVVLLIRTVSGSPNKWQTNIVEDSIIQTPILKVIVKMAVPYIMVFGVYIIVNGHLAPGSGFSGGAVLSVGFTLCALAFGIEKIRKIYNFRTFIVSSGIALLFYGFVKGYSFFMGASGLSTGIPLGTPGSIFSAGLILPLNICIGVVVTGTVYSFYALFSEGEV